MRPKDDPLLITITHRDFGKNTFSSMQQAAAFLSTEVNFGFSTIVSKLRYRFKHIDDFKIEYDKTPKKRTKTLEDYAREADECGLSYGKYKALLELGKTYEDLKFKYEESQK